MRQSGSISEARQRQRILAAIHPYLDQLFAAREALSKLTIELMASPPTMEEAIGVLSISELVAGIRRGFDATVRTLPSEMRVTSLVSDVRKSIEEVERQATELATRTRRAG